MFGKSPLLRLSSPRCTRPPGALGNPLVVCFGDGAFPAFNGATYLQWQISCTHGLGECGHDYDANLLLAKARVTPLAGYTIPRSELSGTVLQTRLGLTAVKALQSEQSLAPRGAVILSDSKCSISSVDTTSRVLNHYFIIYWLRQHDRDEEALPCRRYLSGEDNPADLGTRGHVKVDDLGPGSFW